MTFTESDAPPTCVGILLWRRTPRGRKVFCLERDRQLILPKGLVDDGEEEGQGARRLARAFAGARVGAGRPREVPPGDEGAVSWWELRWRGAAEEQSPLEGSRPLWLPLEEAQRRLAHRAERELVHGMTPTLLSRWRDAWDRPRAARARRTEWLLEDLRRRIESRAQGDATGDAPSGWRERALLLLDRAGEAYGAGDGPGWRTALHEAQRLDLYGLDPLEREAKAEELAMAAEQELEGSARMAVLGLLRDGAEANALVRAAALLDAAREERSAAREERALLGSALAVGLLGLWILGQSAWFSTDAALRPDGLYLGVALLGAIGGATSALLSPGRGPALLRPILGGLVAMLLWLVVAAGVLSLGPLSPAAWSVVAFVAGFGERFVTRAATQ